MFVEGDVLAAWWINKAIEKKCDGSQPLRQIITRSKIRSIDEIGKAVATIDKVHIDKKVSHRQKNVNFVPNGASYASTTRVGGDVFNPQLRCGSGYETEVRGWFQWLTCAVSNSSNYNIYDIGLEDA